VLSGILRCAGCSYAMKASTGRTRHGKAFMEYRCKPGKAAGRCPAPAASKATVIEPYVVEAFFAEVGEVTMRSHESTQEIEAAERSLERAQLELDAVLSGDLADALGGVDAPKMIETIRRRREAVDAAEVERDRLLAGSPPVLPEMVTLTGAWPELDVGERRHLIAACFDSVFLRRTANPRAPIGDRVKLFSHGTGPPVPVRGVRGVIRTVTW
jgi:hypothetical protein